MKSRGSTLLLGMVIVSIVLASGVGVSTLLLRQMRGVGDKETAAIAFYVADTIAEGMEKGVIEKPVEDWEQINWEDVEREIWYKGEKEGGTYLIKINIGDNYYNFERDVGEEEEEEEKDILAYYNDPNNWMDEYGAITARYDVYNGDDVLKEMGSSDYKGWFKAGVDLKEIEGSHIRIHYCSGSKEENEGCSDDGESGWWEPEEIAKVSICYFNECQNPETLFVYYDNAYNWNTVTIRYDVYNGDDVLKEMGSSAYGEWTESYLDITTEMEGSHVRFRFCSGTVTDPGECDDDGPTGWLDEDEAIGIFCVEGGSGEEKRCVSP